MNLDSFICGIGGKFNCIALLKSYSDFRTTEPGEESMTQDDYHNETFESEATTNHTQTPSQPPRGPVKPTEAAEPAATTVKSPVKSPLRKTSESESEDSFSVAGV